jgi:hypothetical protein
MFDTVRFYTMGFDAMGFYTMGFYTGAGGWLLKQGRPWARPTVMSILCSCQRSEARLTARYTSRGREESGARVYWALCGSIAASGTFV